MYKLLDWIDINKISWDLLSSNPNAIDLLERNQDKINWDYLSLNENAIDLLKQNIEEIDWENLALNKNAIELMKENQENIDWYLFSTNLAIFELDYTSLKVRCSIYKEELIKKALHPSRIMKYLESGIDLEDIDNII